MRTPLSVTIITLNEAARIEACLRSVSFADEILVVDSGSTDATVEIAQRFGARVLQKEWLGFGPQKQFAVDQASHDWVLCLDADERVTPELAQALQQQIETAEASAYEMPRCNQFLGRWLRHGEGYPDWSLRLFDRRQARWSQDPVHEKVESDGVIGRIQADLLHESADRIDRYLQKQNRYTSLQAQILFERGKRASVGQILFSPLLRFFKFYVVRRGFQDGLPGLIHILIGCMNSFFKYAKLYELTKLEAGKEARKSS